MIFCFKVCICCIICTFQPATILLLSFCPNFSLPRSVNIYTPFVFVISTWFHISIFNIFTFKLKICWCICFFLQFDFTFSFSIFLFFSLKICKCICVCITSTSIFLNVKLDFSLMSIFSYTGWFAKMWLWCVREHKKLIKFSSILPPITFYDTPGLVFD